MTKYRRCIYLDEDSEHALNELYKETIDLGMRKSFGSIVGDCLKKEYAWRCADVAGKMIGQ